MTEELKSYFRDVDYAVDTFIEGLDSRYRRWKHEQDTIDDVMKLRFIKKRDENFVREIQWIPEHIIKKIYD